MKVQEKLAILADAAKYDVSCGSSGSRRAPARDGKGLGAQTGMGICHSFTPDGRCVSLLKLLLTNFCIYDCVYCVNRNSSNVRRARFTVDEVVALTLDFYKRNYIDGLFLSSGIIRSPDHTMEEMVRIARALRVDHGFRGYIHLKSIPDADQALVEQAGRYADRLSINVELPTETSLNRLAPQKDVGSIRRSMGGLRQRIDEARAERRAPRFAPAGQTTQMIVGADTTPDTGIIAASATLYRAYGLRRVYYSAFSPIPDSSAALPPAAPPLVREHRLYQADWLVRFYGFAPEEIVTGTDGMLDLERDPKTAWALSQRGQFPVDVNRAPREMLLRVPGLGVRTVESLLALRQVRKVRLDDLARLRVALGKVTPFVVTADHRPRMLDRADLERRLAPRPQQLALL
ncbi:MAG: putative DNA modification/repair radical SAM protein [Bacteroidales bacterium]